jgi:uncharacterized protein
MRDGYFIIDGDGHVLETADGGQALRSHMEPQYRSRPLGGGSTADRSVDGKYGQNPSTAADRIRDMDVEGIDVAVLYPTTLLAGWRLRDRGYSVAAHRAYNDWLADYCSYDPDRLKGVAALPMVEPAEAVRELERCARQLGHVGAMAATSVYNHQINDECYDDLYACAQQHDLPVAFHASGSEIEQFNRFDTFLAEHTIGHTFEQMSSVILVVYGGILEKFPRLRVGFLEGMAGWIPMLAERMDEEYEHRPFEAPLLTREPSDYFKESRMFFGVEPEEGPLPHVIQYLGTDQTLLYSSDYPHWDGAFPNSTRKLVERADLSDETKRNILGENARRFYTSLAPVPTRA